MRISFTSADYNKYWEALSKFIELGPSLTDKGIYSYYFPQANTTLIAPVFAPTLTVDEVNSLLAPFFDILDKNAIEHVKNATHYDNFYDAWTGTDTVSTFNPEPVGGQSILTSRLIPRSVVEGNLPAVIEQFQKFVKSTDEVPGHVVVFNQAPTRAAGGDLSDNAVNPAWRKAAIHFITS
jgi:hypothetical protein